MTGSDTERFCEQCHRSVHNLSAMTQTERAAFAERSGGRECIAYLTHPNGSIANLSFLTFLRRWMPPLRSLSWSALASLLPIAFAGCAGAPIPKEDPPQENKTNKSNANQSFDTPNQTTSDGKTHSVKSPNQKLRAFAREIPDEELVKRQDLNGCRIDIFAFERGLKKVFAHKKLSRRIVAHMAWSPDSQYLVFSTTSSGGHSPWHFNTYVFSVSAKQFQSIDDLVGPVISRDFSFKAPDIIQLQVRAPDNDGMQDIGSKALSVSLAKVLQK